MFENALSSKVISRLISVNKKGGFINFVKNSNKMCQYNVAFLKKHNIILVSRGKTESKKIGGTIKMENVVNTVLYCYPSFQSVINGMERLAYFKAISSFKDCTKTLSQIEEILQINSQKERLKNLKRTVECILSQLSTEEKMLIEYKFFKIKPSEDYDCTSRKYFRKQNKLYKKLLEIFKVKSLDNEWFEENYFDIYFLKCKYLRFKTHESKKGVKNSTTFMNF